MKKFRMMLLPLIVGTLLLFCGAPKAAADTCGLDSITSVQLMDGQWTMAAGSLDLRSLLADGVNPMAIFFNLTDSFKIDTPNFTLASEKGHIWILAFLDVPEETVTGSLTSLTSFSPISASVTATTLTTVNTTVPESSSLLYLGSGLVVCGGFWLRRRRF